MCEPTTIALLAVAAAGAFAQKSASDAAVMQQAETANNNTREGYRVAQESDRAAQAQAFEAQTDRTRKAAQQLSMARVIAAEGGGSLAARAININAGAAEDYSRIDASLANQRSTVRGQVAAAQTQNADALGAANAAFGANQIRFLSSIGSAAAGAGAREYGQSVQRTTQKNLEEDYLLKKDK
ncbi:virion core protein, T7 gp14 family [Variovorax paradoxus]|uniref:virion core protein, T7 gp14 family n=1 Tax=Variovorax paradoxus TaxID=34073 RepID=UPI00285B2F11|nr:hypothetical protein [Variovorax paradoxus]MDR6455498.1 hypothetical protein [Variovorax paradoxus]